MPPKSTVPKKSTGPKKSVATRAPSTIDTAIESGSSASASSSVESAVSVGSKQKGAKVMALPKRSTAANTVKQRTSILKKQGSKTRASGRTKRRSGRSSEAGRATKSPKARKSISKKTKTMKAPAGKFDLYIKRLFKEVNHGRESSMLLSDKANTILDAFANDLMDRIAKEAAELMNRSGKKTLQARDIKFATRLVLPLDQSNYAIVAGERALFKNRGGVDADPETSDAAKDAATKTAEKMKLKTPVKTAEKSKTSAPAPEKSTATAAAAKRPASGPASKSVTKRSKK